MNNKILSISLCFAFLSSIAYAQKSPQYIFPTTTFDEAEAEKLMEPGTAAIRGNAFLKKKGQTTFASRGSKVILLPVTPYFTEFIELKKKYNGKKKKMATISNLAFSYRVEGKYLDFDGNFEFTHLKPGKYYVVTWIPFEKKKNVTLQTGTREYYNVYSGNVTRSEAVYSDYTYHYEVEDEVIGLVEVKNGSVTNVVVSN